MHTKSSLLLIGSGRLAFHLRHWLKLNNPTLDLQIWSRQDSLDTLQLRLNKAQKVLLAIKDDSLVSFYETHLEKNQIPTVHFSGALYDSRLIGAHPLMSFTPELLPESVYHKIHFALDTQNQLEDILPCFKNPYTFIKPEQKPLYHALSVLTGNFPQLIWNETFAEFHKLNIPNSALELYLQQIASNFINSKTEALTGPIVRKDLNTIQKNMSAIQNQSKLHSIYQIFA